MVLHIVRTLPWVHQTAALCHVKQFISSWNKIPAMTGYAINIDSNKIKDYIGLVCLLLSHNKQLY